MRIPVATALREVLDSYVGLYAERKRLMASPPDGASYEDHTLRLQEHVRRVHVVLEQLRQTCEADPAAPTEASGDA